MTFQTAVNKLLEAPLIIAFPFALIFAPTVAVLSLVGLLLEEANRFLSIIAKKCQAPAVEWEYPDRPRPKTPGDNP